MGGVPFIFILILICCLHEFTYAIFYNNNARKILNPLHTYNYMHAAVDAQTVPRKSKPAAACNASSSKLYLV